MQVKKSPRSLLRAIGVIKSTTKQEAPIIRKDDRGQSESSGSWCPAHHAPGSVQLPGGRLMTPPWAGIPLGLLTELGLVSTTTWHRCHLSSIFMGLRLDT